MLHITHEAVMPNPGPLEDQHQPCQPSATSGLYCYIGIFDVTLKLH